jgi:alkaline phosphatase D
MTAQETAICHMANGVKIGEVSSTSVVVWTRLTRHPERNTRGMQFPGDMNSQHNGGRVVHLCEMEGSVPGAMGEVRVAYWPTQEKARRNVTEWQSVRADKDFTRQIQIAGLLPGTRYSMMAEGRPPGSAGRRCAIEGGFRTAPKADTPAPVRFAVVTCQEYRQRDDLKNGHRIYPVMQELDLRFFVHTGDIEYYDRPGPYADSVERARFKWNRLYAMPYQRDFHNRTVSYFMKDDHDTLKNDCWPGQRYGSLTWEQGLALFREQVPMGQKTYRTFRWGRDLQIWMVEGRDFRSPNTMPDGPEKSIWGLQQKQWFFETVRASDATARVLISPTPIVGPDRRNKNDNHANRGFAHEGREIREFIGKQKNMFIICGDRHWQYISRDPQTGIREYSCGPTTESHAGGFNEKNRSPMHQYLNITGGFLSVAVDRTHGALRVVFRHHGIDGTVYNEDIVHLEEETPTDP